MAPDTEVKLQWYSDGSFVRLRYHADAWSVRSEGFISINYDQTCTYHMTYQDDDGYVRNQLISRFDSLDEALDTISEIYDISTTIIDSWFY